MRGHYLLATTAAVGVSDLLAAAVLRVAGS